MNEDTFWGVGTMPVIAVFTAHRPHPLDKLVKFINFQDDGYISQPHVGRIHTPDSDLRKEYLIKVWNDEIETDKNFCIKTTVNKDDEWLYNFYHSNLSIPGKDMFDERLNKYFVFQCRMMLDGKSYLFNDEEKAGKYKRIEELRNKNWGVFKLGDDFIVDGAKVTKDTELSDGEDIPRVTTSMLNNAYEGFYSLHQNNGKKIKVNKGKVITVETATKGESFYQPADFIANAHVMTIKLKNREMNQYIGLFLSVCIMNAIKNKYYYGYKFSKFRILKEQILLPITEDGTIDYEYMEQYVKNMLIKKVTVCNSYNIF